MIPVRSQWGRYNLPRYITPWFFTCPIKPVAELRVTRIVGIPLKWQGDVSLRHRPLHKRVTLWCSECENSDATAVEGFWVWKICDGNKWWRNMKLIETYWAFYRLLIPPCSKGWRHLALAPGFRAFEPITSAGWLWLPAVGTLPPMNTHRLGKLNGIHGKSIQCNYMPISGESQ